MSKLRVLAEAESEANEAAWWYEQAEPGLGSEFLQAVEAAYAAVVSDLAPLVRVPHKAGRRGLKRFVLARFPYDVIVYPNRGQLVVIAIAHHARRPGYWSKRLKSSAK